MDVLGCQEQRIAFRGSYILNHIHILVVVLKMTSMLTWTSMLALASILLPVIGVSGEISVTSTRITNCPEMCDCHQGEDSGPVQVECTKENTLTSVKELPRLTDVNVDRL